VKHPELGTSHPISVALGFMTMLHDRLGRHRWLHSLVAVLRIYPIADLVLRRVPIQRRVGREGLVYRVTSLDQLSIEYGIFTVEEYAAALTFRHPIKTFIDLGCNAGWFSIWLVARGVGPMSRGLLVDAHPRMVLEAIWHMQRNHLPYSVVHGAVGLPPGQSSTNFYLHPSSSASSVVPYDSERQLPVKGKIIPVTVPAISVAAEWYRLYGDAEVDLLKLDVEGKELDFVQYESMFLQDKVRAMLVEWHEWSVALNQLDKSLDSIGFKRLATYHERNHAGLAAYEKTSSVQ
jgi:FkbM family methyltransferase